MENTELDAGLSEVQAGPEKEHFADTGQRFIHYLIDIIACYVLQIGFAIILLSQGYTGNTSLADYAIAFISIFLYYTIMEVAFQKTLGKMITNTRVVTLNGEKPTPKQILLRSLIRLIPFEFLSVFSSNSVMWHDSWVDLRVVKNKAYPI